MSLTLFFKPSATIQMLTMCIVPVYMVGMKNIIKDTEINVPGLGVSDTLTFDAVY